MSDYMKLNVMRPEVLVDINRLSATEYGKIEATDGGLRIGALASPRSPSLPRLIAVSASQASPRKGSRLT